MIRKFKGKFPDIDKSCFIAESADIIGDVKIGENSTVWFGAVIRGDDNSISIGKRSNIQDNCIIHPSSEKGKVIIGDNVTVGHGAILHGCTIAGNGLIGMGSIILDGAEVGEFSMIGAGSLVTGGKKIPSGVLCLGSPAKVIRELTEEEKEYIKNSAGYYVELIEEYK